MWFLRDIYHLRPQISGFVTIFPDVELLRGGRACAGDRTVYPNLEGPHSECCKCPPIQEPPAAGAHTSS